MSDPRDPKRARISDTPPPTFDDDLPFDDETLNKAVAWGESFSTPRRTSAPFLCTNCSSHICTCCANLLKDIERRQQQQSELQQMSKNFDTDLLQSIPISKHYSQKAPVKQFRMRVPSDREEAVGTVTSVPSNQRTTTPSLDSTAPRSLLGYDNLLSLLKRNLTLSPTAPIPESQLKLIALDELKKFPVSQRISILGCAFELSTASLGGMLRKGTEETSARRSLYSRFSSASTQLNTLESYSLFTILNCCDTHANYLFSEEIAKRVVSILSTLTQMCINIPEARELIFAEHKTHPSRIFPRRQEIDPKRHTAGGSYASKPLRELGKRRTRANSQTPSLFSDSELFSWTKFPTIGVELVTKSVEVLLHPQINREVVVACLDFLSTLNLFNPGNHLDCLHRVLIDNQLNTIFELDNLDLRVVHAIVRFYNTLPLIPLFTHYFTPDLFQRFIYFVCNHQKPERLFLRVKSDILFFLSKTIDMHKKSLVQASITHVSDLTQAILRSTDLSWVDQDDLLLQVRMLFFFFSRDNPKVFGSSTLKKERNVTIRTIKGMKEVFVSLKAAFNLLNIDLAGLRSWQFLIFA